MKAKQLYFRGKSLHDNSGRWLQLAQSFMVHSLAGHLNTALTVSDLSGSAMPTPRSINCSAWYNFASSVWDSSAWAKVRGHVMAGAGAKEVQSCTHGTCFNSHENMLEVIDNIKTYKWLFWNETTGFICVNWTGKCFFTVLKTGMSIWKFCFASII